ncbi:uncharacterized protein LOC122078565 [Macadamia integrifolia]|uniref:uncharacterized protein LOC122078565 n=1 Tax=Macadamia integrifolia TaxID=60698 RepID=UPI001C4EE0C7|nr:uncharacterized protein LOC122078565 [Macadamia integrifolia]
MVVEDHKGKQVVEDVNLDCTQRYRYLSPQLVKIALQASNSAEGFALVKNGIKELCQQLESINVSDVPKNLVPNEVSNINNGLVLKQKNPLTQKGSRRKKPWVEKQGKKRKSGGPSTELAAEFTINNVPVSFTEVLQGTFDQALSQFSSQTSASSILHQYQEWV